MELGGVHRDPALIMIEAPQDLDPPLRSDSWRHVTRVHYR
jgi:hypothetical protein